jgi:hypothetical protein
VKEKTPDVFAVTVAVAAPVNFTVAPDPPDPLIVPVTVKVCVELKLAVLLAPLIVTAWLVGVKTKLALVGVTVYEPFGTEKLYTPDAFAVVVTIVAPVNVTVAPDPPVPLIVPLIVKVCAELKLAVLFAPLIVTA